MTTPALTEREKADIRKRLYDEKAKDYQFILEAMGEATTQQAFAIKRAIATRDSEWLMHQIVILIQNYIDSELMEDAEREVMASKSVNGRRWLEA